MKKLLISISVILLFFLFVYFIKVNVTTPKGIQTKIEQIQSEYNGIITDKFSVRDTKPTHLKVKTSSGSIEIIPYQKIVDFAEIGDSLIKPKNQNFVYLKKPNGNSQQFFYTKLSLETRQHEIFPKEWKNKWMESSAWDK